MEVDDTFNLYVNTHLSEEDVKTMINEKFSGEIQHYWINLSHIKVEVHRNEEFDANEASTSPHGFLHFRYRLVIEALTENEELYIRSVSDLLQFLWSNNIPAVAACDFEEQLPKQGHV